jgi:hypothetical protein
MARQKKKRKELETIILDRCLQAGMKLESVKVFPSRLYLWGANYQANPSLWMTYLTEFERIVAELRASYDLAKSHPSSSSPNAGRPRKRS